MQLSVIIVSYNVKYFLEQCLASVTDACKNLQAEIWVVDNNSTDGSRSYLEARFPQVNFIWQSTNPGFACANNIALKKVSGKKVLFLNPDTILQQDSLEKCLLFFDQQANPGALGIHMIDGAGNFLKESKRGFPSPLTSFFKILGLAGAFPSSKLFARYYLGHLPEKVSNKAAVLSGAFMLVSKQVLDITGGFDEAFFMYGEDIDLSYRIQKAGFDNFYFSGSTIIHFKGESSQKNTPAYINAFYGAMQLFVKKHHSKYNAIFYSTLLKATIFAKQLSGNLKTNIGKGNGRPGEHFRLIQDAKTLIVAGPQTFKMLQAALIKFNPGFNIVPMDESWQEPTYQMNQLSAIVKQHTVRHIVFSTDQVSMGQIIDAMQLLPEDLHFSFHLAGTKSIVSSSDKNSSGFCIPLDL